MFKSFFTQKKSESSQRESHLFGYSEFVELLEYIQYRFPEERKFCPFLVKPNDLLKNEVLPIPAILRVE